jgi:hypothetical protein
LKFIIIQFNDPFLRRRHRRHHCGRLRLHHRMKARVAKPVQNASPPARSAGRVRCTLWYLANFPRQYTRPSKSTASRHNAPPASPADASAALTRHESPEQEPESELDAPLARAASV